MSDTTAALADRLEQENNALIAAVEAMSAAQWQAKTPAEGWTAAAAAHHVAGSHQTIAGLVQAVATGHPLPPVSMADFDGPNAQHAQEFAVCDRAETLAMLLSGCSTAAGIVRGLSDEQLGVRAKLVTELPEVSVQQVIENILIGQVMGHEQSIRAAQ